MEQFYTYLWLREDGTPYYVGKGKDDRAFYKHSHRFNPPPAKRITIYPAESESEAFENEIALIWYYGRKDLGTGCLRNLTDGGENPPRQVVGPMLGKKHSEETKRKMSAAREGKKAPPRTEEQRKRMSEAGRGRKMPPCSESTKLKISQANKGRVMSEEQKQAISKALTGRTTGRKGIPLSPETREKISVGNMGNIKWLGIKHTEESRKKMSESAKRRQRR